MYAVSIHHGNGVIMVCCLLFLIRTEAVQGTERQIEQAHHPECTGSLLPGGKSERGPKEQDPGGENIVFEIIFIFMAKTVDPF